MSKEYTFTETDIVRERDELGQSWAQVAANLDLANPGQARKAYTDLTGNSFKDSKPTVKREHAKEGEPGTAKVRTRRKVLRPDWDDDSDQDEIIDRCTRAKLVVTRKVGGSTITEEVQTGNVRRLSYDRDDGAAGLTIHVAEVVSGGLRSFRVADIAEVK